MNHGSCQNYKFPHGLRQKLQTKKTFIAKPRAARGRRPVQCQGFKGEIELAN